MAGGIIRGVQPDRLGRGSQFLQGATNSYASQRRLTREPEKTVGGGLVSTASMAAAGASVGTAVAPGYGTAIGAGVGALAGLATYLFS